MAKNEATVIEERSQESGNSNVGTIIAVAALLGVGGYALYTVLKNKATEGWKLLGQATLNVPIAGAGGNWVELDAATLAVPIAGAGGNWVELDAGTLTVPVVGAGANWVQLDTATLNVPVVTAPTTISFRVYVSGFTELLPTAAQWAVDFYDTTLNDYITGGWHDIYDPADINNVHVNGSTFLRVWLFDGVSVLLGPIYTYNQFIPKNGETWYFVFDPGGQTATMVKG
jgi:hypothetical protein